MGAPYSGRCFCGDIRYRVTEEPIRRGSVGGHHNGSGRDSFTIVQHNGSAVELQRALKRVSQRRGFDCNKSPRRKPGSAFFVEIVALLSP